MTPATAAAAAPWRHTAEEVVASWQSDAHSGLSSAEAAARLERFGRNELTEKAAVPAWRRFVAHFADMLVILLLIAAAISAVLWFVEGNSALPYEALAIFAVVLLNAAMGFVQETRAEAAVTALRAMSADTASVVRDGEQRSAPAAELVPGDIVLIEAGDTIPADVRLIKSIALHTMEAALTGESLPISKDTPAIGDDAALVDRDNMLFSGTSATYGRGRGIVTATGMHTEMGRIAGLLADTPAEATPLQRELNRTGRLLGVIVVIIALAMIGVIILVQDVTGASALFDVLMLGVALAVAAVPEGLPAVVTAVLALGVQRMARRNAIVRKLSAVETLGSARIIASDKTGTLTKNEMTVRVVATASGRVSIGGTGYAPTGEVRNAAGGPIGPALQIELERALAVADRANNASVYERNGQWEVHGDPTEAALLVAGRKAGVSRADLEARLPRMREVPFSSERKLMSTIHRESTGEERAIVFTKGAPDVLLARCTHEVIADGKRELTPERRAEILRTNESLADQALRTLGVAAHWLNEEALLDEDLESTEHELVFVGLIGMIDPPRPDAMEAVRRAHSAGIRSLMITGDHPRTASVIARELGISRDGRTITGSDLARIPEGARPGIVNDVSVYARVNPEDKLRIVSALQSGGAIVAMTGDGVNDAPALKMADIGVAMGITGTDVSKEAADIVLADDNFASIVSAVEEGRAIFANIRRFLRYLLSSNIGEVLTMFFGVLLAKRIGLQAHDDGVVLPLLATQILWINLVTDGAPALALGVDPPDQDLMARPPRPPRERVITPRMWRGIVFVGVIMALGTLLVLDASMPGGFFQGAGELAYGQTMAFTTLMLFQMFNVLNARADDRSAFVRLFKNRWLWGALGLSVLLQAMAIYLPFLQRAFGTVALGPRDWLMCTAVASAVLWLREANKIVTRSRQARARDGVNRA